MVKIIWTGVYLAKSSPLLVLKPCAAGLSQARHLATNQSRGERSVEGALTYEVDDGYEVCKLPFNVDAAI